ncbi:uncharacterized protein LOC112577329 [Pomacea canaliculata]|uniref:uncharacterized protein LOC112577329 n=1 Tax=Pomacea canaliculata TaxID=400727 RepID=UPI000D73475C|nr:uncharacterized protein LOC112577329 [Pomacea canaliculata]
MTNIDNNSTSLSDHDIRLYLEDLSLRSWYNRKPVAIYLCTLVVVGSLGNTWCFLVYFFCFSVNSTRVLVLAMSLCDLVTNLIGLPLQIYTIRHAYDSFDVPLCRSMFIFATIPTQLSGFLILLVAYDRYRYICRPFCVKRDTTKAMTQVVIAVIVTFVIFLPFAWLYGYHTVDSPLPGVKAVMCWIHDDYRNGPYIRAYLIVLSTVFFVGLFILTILYSLIGETIFRHRFSMSVRLRSVTVVYPHPSKGENLLTHLSKPIFFKSKAWGSKWQCPQCQFKGKFLSDDLSSLQSSSQQNHPIQTTIMMAALTALYIVNWLPHLLARATTDRPVNLCDNFTDCGYNFYALSLRSYYLHSASNAFIYSFWNSTFRKESRNLFWAIVNYCKR